MIDDLGGYERAIELARAEAKLSNYVPVRRIDHARGLLELIDGNDEEHEAAVKAELTPTLADASPLPISPEWRAFTASYAPLVRGERALTTMHYVITIR